MVQSSKSIYLPVVVACLSLFALGWMDNARGPFFPLFLDATGESSSKGAMFFAVASFVAILSSALAGSILQKFGLKKLLLMGGLAMSLSPFGLVVFPNMNGALITAFLFGMSLGWVAVGQNILISLVEEEKLRQRLFSLLHCFYALAAMSAPLSVLYLKTIVNWNWLLVGVTALTAPFLICSFFLDKDKNEKPSKTEQVKPPPITDFWVLIWVMFLSFYVSPELILSTRLVVFVQGFGLDFETASKHLFFFFLSMFVVRLFFFFVELSVGAIKILLTCLGLALLFIFLGYQSSTYYFAFVGGAIGPVFPVVMAQMAKMWPQRFDVLVARVIALSSLFVVAAHMIVGKMTDAIGIQKAIYAVPTLMSLAVVILLITFIKKQKTDV